MTDELKALAADLDLAFFRYAHLTGALELYTLVLERRDLQRAVSRLISDSETEWKQVHRYMVLDGQTITWYDALPVPEILRHKDALYGFLYGVTLTCMLNDLDFYLRSLLENRFGRSETSGNAWKLFVEMTRIDLPHCRNGEFVYVLFQERHKIEHNQAKIDRLFLERMTKVNIRHAYQAGDRIQKSHLDVLTSHRAIREFSEDVDRALPSV